MPIPPAVAGKSIRCLQCGAKNDLTAQLCRICGLLTPQAEEIRRRGAGGDGVVFKETVEREREAWREYSAGRSSTAARSRRPAELPNLPPKAWGDPAAYVSTLPNANVVVASRRSKSVVPVVVVIVAIILLVVFKSMS